jgi:hypothetical protein
MTDGTGATEPGKNRITLEVSRDNFTGGLQLSISQLDENDHGHGYRIKGPKFLGDSATLLSHDLTQRDAGEIRGYLDAAFPQDAAIKRLTAENERMTQQLCLCMIGVPAEFDPSPECPIHGDPREEHLLPADALKWRGAYECLHARLLRDLPGDGSELPQPDDPFWAAQLDALAAYAGELYRATAAGTVPADTEKRGV